MAAPCTQEEPTINKPISPAAGGGLRKRFIEDMAVRGFTEKTRRSYLRIVSGFAAFLGRSPDPAPAEDIRRFQVHQFELGMHAPGMNGNVAALRFFFTQTLDRPDLSSELIRPKRFTIAAVPLQRSRPRKADKLPVPNCWAFRQLGSAWQTPNIDNAQEPSRARSYRMRIPQRWCPS